MDKQIDWISIQNAYPVNEQKIWLNNCGTTPPGRFVLDEIRASLEASAIGESYQNRFSVQVIKQGIQTILAQLLDTEPDDIAIIHNTAEGIMFVAHGLGLEKGDEILIQKNEYPSAVYPWHFLLKKGIIIREIDSGICPEDFLRNLENGYGKNTRLACFSAVHWCTGMPIPVKQIASFCTANNISLVIDGAQGVGHIELKMSWGISFLAFSAWKWLLGPSGLGFLVIPKKNLDTLCFEFKGTESIVNPHSYLPYSDTIKPSAERYMFSTSSYLDWVYCRAGLEFLAGIGFDQVMQRIYGLSGFLAAELRKLGFSVTSDSFPGWKTGILTAASKKIDAKTLEKELSSQGIMARERLGRIRFAPHVYISFEQLEKTIATVKKIVS